jgi:hypothetical protein
MMQNIGLEYRSNIDKFSQDVIIAQLELLLTYSKVLYHCPSSLSTACPRRVG